MTILESLHSVPFFDAHLVEVVAVERGFDTSLDFSTNTKKERDLILADLIMEIVVSPKFSEGDLSVEYDVNALKEKAKNIYAQYGDDKLNQFKSGDRIINVGVRFE